MITRPVSRRRVLRTISAGVAASSLTSIAAPTVSRASDPKVLRFIPSADLASVDPVVSSAGVTQNHAYAVFDTLFGQTGAGEVKPQMAEGASVSDDRLTWTVRLRDGLQFHDGEPVLARDCAASLARWSKRDTFGQMLGSAVAEWGAADDHTVRIRLHRPFPHLLEALGKPSVLVPFMMPERIATTDAATPIQEVVGSGPYRFKASERVVGSLVVYERFEGYVPRSEAPDWGTGGKVANLDRVEWHVLPDPSTAAAALQTGEMDWWDVIHPDVLPIVQAAEGVKLGRINALGYLAILQFNTLHPPFDKPEIRRLVMNGISQPDYLTTLTSGEPDAWRECRSLFPCGTPYENESYGAALAGPRDIDRLKEDLKKAGYAGERVVIVNPTDMVTITPMGRLTADLLQRAGMNVDLQEMDWSAANVRSDSKAPIDQGGWSIFHTWFSSQSIANPAVNLLIRGQGDDSWIGWHKNEQSQKLAAEWLDAEDPAEARRLADGLQEIAFQDAPVIPLGQFFTRTAYRDNVVGVLPGIAPYFWNVRKEA